ncbi:MAG: hypothetical protein IJ642_09140 [Oscillospiraceae bacterium]|nr:hypothetical protein [Oscillospiraceae bacterium]
MNPSNKKQAFKILKILEEDYGCEGVPDDEEPLCRVLLEDQNQNQIWKKIPDSYLTAHHLNENDTLCLDLSEF